MLPPRLPAAVMAALMICLCVTASTGTAAAAPPRSAPAVVSFPQRRIASVQRLAALGDSVPAGGACSCTPFPRRVAALIAARAGHGVITHNDAVGGLTTLLLLEQLRHDRGIRSDVAWASVVLVEVGANDISSRTCGLTVSCYSPAVRRVGTLLDAVVHQIKVLRGRRATAIVLIGYWNIWRDGAVARARGAAYVAASVALTKAVNVEIAASSRRNGVTYVDLWVPFRGTTDRDDTALLAADGDHPNARGHQVIAVAIARALARRILT